MTHDFLASVVREHPTRFFALATLPMQDRDAAEAEFERCIDKHGMKGILLYSNLDGRFPDEPEFRQLFAEAEKRGVPLLLHPACPVTFRVARFIADVAMPFPPRRERCRNEAWLARDAARLDEG